MSSINKKSLPYTPQKIVFDLLPGRSEAILNTSQLKQVFDNFKPDTIIHLAACADLNIFAKYYSKLGLTY